MVFNYDNYEVEHTALVTQLTLSHIHDVIGIRGITWLENPQYGDLAIAGVFDLLGNGFVIFVWSDTFNIGQIQNSEINQGCSFKSEHMLYFRDIY